MNGIILVDKPQGWTSHDVVAKLRGIYQQRRIGHSGTLDPMATGVLAVFLGRGTRAVELCENDEKEYVAELLLGTVTNTQDITGEVLEQHPVEVSRQQLEAVLEQFLGPQQQIPPMYSAVKIGGKKLYELARKGQSVERKPRSIVIHELELCDFDGKTARIRVVCSKGTYIRTLCHDIGAKLSVGGCMKELLRTKVGRFELSESLTLDELQKLKEEDRLAEAVLPVEEVFKELPEIRSDTEELDKLLKNGNPFRSRAVKAVKGGDMFRVYHSDGTFIGVFKYDEEKHMYYPEKIFLGGN